MDFLPALAGAVRAGACQILGLPRYINDLVARTSFPVQYDSPIVAAADFLRRSLCNTDAPPPEPPQFTGGQCVGVNYNVGVRATRAGVPINNTSASGIGPVRGLRLVRVPTPTPINPNFVRLDAFVDFANASVSVGSYDAAQDTVFVTGVTRPDGLPDNCGNPDPVYEDLTPDDVTINNNVTYQNNDGLDVTIPVVIVYARANIDVNGYITIPFTLQLSPTVNVTGTIGIDGTVNFNFGSAAGGSTPKDPRKGRCEDIALPDGEVEEDPTDSDQPEEPERDRERAIKGVLVTVTSLSNERASTIVQDENPDIYVPSLGHVNFLCRVGETAGGWTTDIQVKNRRHLIQCPWDWGAVAVRGTPQPGVTWVLTPVYGYAGQPVEYVQ